MNMEATYEQLRALGLHGMAESYKAMMILPPQKRPALQRGIEKMIEQERCTRSQRLTDKLLKAAKLRFRVHMEDISCSPERNLTEEQLADIADCSFIRRGENLLITGLTGSGKSWLACAEGNQACQLGLSVLYLNLNHFADELTKSRLDGTYQNLLRRLNKKDLIILDDFGLHDLTPEARIALLTLLEDRYEKKSMIIASQLPLDKWYDYIAEPTLADAIMDRLINTSIHVDLKGDSLRGKGRNRAHKK